MKQAKSLNLIVLLLCLIFACTCFGVMGVGAKQYYGTVQTMQHYFNVRVPLNYMIRKVRENNDRDSVIVASKEGHQVLVLKKQIKDKVYETWIYEYEGELYELFIESGNQPSLDLGTALMPIKELKFKQEGCYLKIQLESEAEQPLEVVLMIRG